MKILASLARTNAIRPYGAGRFLGCVFQFDGLLMGRAIPIDKAC
jgi:hypothetical protein